MGEADRSPDEDSFRALARSSPWRWSTLRFTRTERWPTGSVQRAAAPVRAWLRRPDRLRVEHRDTGELLGVVREGGAGATPLVRAAGWFRGWGRSATVEESTAPDVADETPALRADGLAVSRPSRWQGPRDAPMWLDDRWVAMLDPVELADGVVNDEGRWRPGTVLTDLAASRHHGRPVWDAIVRPTTAYDPRCPCCPLLLHTETSIPPPASVGRAEAHHVRLDVGTGVCVHVRQIGGTHDGWTLDVAVEEVDAPMVDRLFTRAPRSAGEPPPARPA